MKSKVYQLEQNIKTIARLRKERCGYEDIIEWLHSHAELKVSKVTLLNFCKKHGITKGLQNDDVQKVYQELSEEVKEDKAGLDLKSTHIELVHKEESVIFSIQKNPDFFVRSYWQLVPVDAGKYELENEADIFFEHSFIPKSLIAGYCLYQDISLPIIPKFYADANQLYSYDI